MNGVPTPPAKDQLYQLLPAFYRNSDAALGGPLQDLLAVFQDVLDTLEADIRGLYENWFIETCADWVIPYIGELVGAQSLYAAGDDTLTARAYVAHTISYRRRKGTAVALQQLASDSTNWPALVIEYFAVIATTQYVNHVRLNNVFTPDLRQTSILNTIGTPFDTIARNIDVRSIGSPPLTTNDVICTSPVCAIDPAAVRGRYNLPNIGIFLWRLASYMLTSYAPCPVTDGTDGRYRFSVLGQDQPLFNRPQTLAAFTTLAAEINVPGELRPRALTDELEARRQQMVDNNMVWIATTNFSAGAEIVDSNGNTQRAMTTGSTSGTQPHWPNTLLAEVSDGGVLWELVAIGAALNGVYFGGDPVFSIALAPGASPIPPEQIMICDLSDLHPPAAAGTWRTLPTTASYIRASDGHTVTLPIAVSVDPALGRFAIAGATPPALGLVYVSACSGFGGELGGGPYNRQASVEAVLDEITPWQVAVSRTLPTQPNLIYKTIAEAVTAWNEIPAAAERFGVITILDNDTYTENLTGSSGVNIPAGSTLLVVAADWPSLRLNGNADSLDLLPSGVRPLLHGDIEVTGVAPGSSNPDANSGNLIINGLLVDGKLTVLPGMLGTVQIAHSTLVPAAGGIIVKASGTNSNDGFALTLSRAICGPIQLPSGNCTITLTDSILDANAADGSSSATVLNAPGADATIQTSTIFGAVGSPSASGLRTLSASDTIFTGSVNVERTQAGCLRFCSLPSTISRVPSRYRCQPDSALASAGGAAAQQQTRARLTPEFTSASYGDPGYTQLSPQCAIEIVAGASNGSEMGAFSFLQQPQRDANLRTVLGEYLRFGLQAGIFYQT